MSEVAGIVLNSILENPDKVLEIWPKLKLQYFNSDYSDIFIAITKYYNKFNKIPNFQSLEMTIRDNKLNKKLKSLELLEISEDIDINIAVEALVDQYTQEEILENLSKYVDKIVQYDSNESILKLSEIVLHMEDVVDYSEEIFLMNDLFLMDEQELHRRVPLSLNNSLDASTGGMELTDLIMIGGHRGSGKTIAACNITTNQYLNGDVSLFFSIEMRANQINGRFMSILSGVSNKSIKNQICTKEELKAIAKVRSEFFVDSEEVYNDFLMHADYKKFEKDLIKSKKLKPDNQIILIDNPTLTLADIDLNIQKFKAKHGDKLKTVIIDYVNQIATMDQYNWQDQIKLSTKLKALAAKHEVLMITPYQTDKTGEARFSKGLLIPADVTTNLVNNGDYITFTSTKTRNIPPFEFNAPIDWNTLRISPTDAIIGDTTDEKPRDIVN